MTKVQIVEQRVPVVNGKSMAWLVIQSSDSDDEDGVWESLFQHDIPDWVKQSEVVGKMMEGKMVCSDPRQDAKWYRAVQCDAPVEH